MTSHLMKIMFPDSDSSSHLPRLQIFNPSGFSLPFNTKKVLTLVELIESEEMIHFNELELVFTDEEGIVEINSAYLDREYITDIISFRYDEDDSNTAIEGTLYCCAPRIAEQSKEFKTGEKEEFFRIIIHGLLHLAGYDDQKKSDKKNMTDLENTYLSKFLN